MKVATRLTLGSGALVLLLFALLLYHVSIVRSLVGVSSELATVKKRAGELALEQIRRAAQIEEFSRKLVVTGDRGFSERLEELSANFQGALTELAALDLSASERDAVRGLQVVWARTPRGGDLESGAGALGESSAQRFAELNRAASEVFTAVERAVHQEARRLPRALDEAQRTSLWVLAAGFTLALLVAAVTLRPLHRFLSRLSEGTRAVAAGSFAYRLPESGDLELARLAVSFNGMVERLAELDQLKKDFLSHVSHELKTPLSSSQEIHRLLLDEIPGPLTPAQRHLLELDLGSSRRLSGMITKLLDLSRLESGGLEYDFKTTDLVELVATALDAARLRGHGAARLSLEAPARSVPVRGDGDRLMQVLENLLDNALKFAPEGSRVEVRIEEPGISSVHLPRGWGRRFPADQPLTLVTVADRGPGVPDPQKERVFQKFHQVRRGGAGVGLGLAICREIVHAHDGAIWVTDRPQGGSVFWLALPRAQADQARPPAPPRVLRAGLLAGLLVLGAGCHSAGISAPEALLAQGQWAEAAVAFEERLAAGPRGGRDRILFHLALLYSFDGSPVSNPDRARVLGRELTHRYPASPYAVLWLRATTLTQLLVERSAALEQERRRLAALETELSELRREHMRLRMEMEHHQQDGVRLQEALEAAAQEEERLRSELAARAQELESLRRELEKLKEIDLSRQP
jgi:two-component system sensor histidine kinase GlrK